ncbi:MAG: hypothetical protein MZW92_31955 [Comamonadaceae bacterium]|nr:hypothetical protein [Comamonadaceae bacterium]
MAATGTGVDFGVNFTGTQTSLVNQMMYQDSASTATGGIADGTLTGDGAEGIIGGGATLTVSTTTPNLNVLTGVVSANENFLAQVVGTIVVTVSGTFQIYAASDVATSQITIKAGSSLRITQF